MDLCLTTADELSGETVYNTVSTDGNNASINCGAENDSIQNFGSNSALNGGEGNDFIHNGYYGTDVTLDAGKVDDTIANESNSNLIIYRAGDGNDVIQCFKANSTLSIAGGVPAETNKSGDDVIVTVGDEKITLKGAAKLFRLNIVETPVNIHNSDKNKAVTATNANDTIINTGEKAAINALRGDDSINNNAAEVLINAGDGFDKISNIGKDVTILSDNGDDTIYSNAANDEIHGSAGTDSIFNHGKKGSIAGDAGDDTIENYNNSN